MILLKVPVNDQKSVKSLVESEVRSANGRMVQRLAKVALWKKKLVHAWEILTLEEEGVDVGVVL